MTLPRVTCVISVRDGERTIADAIRSCLGQDYRGELDIVVADGMSDDATRDIVVGLAHQYPNVKMVDNPDQVTPSGLNAAISVASGSVIVRCDAHAVLPPGYVTRAVEQLAIHNAANVGGVQQAVGQTPLQRAIAMAMTSRLGVGSAKFHVGGPAGPTDTVYLGAFDRAVIEEVGLFNPDMIRNQDYELNHRLRKAGHTVWFDPELSVEYHPRSNLAGLARQYFEYGVGKRRMLKLYPESLKPRQVAPPVLVIGVIVSVVLALLGRVAAAAIVPVIYVAILVGFTIAQFFRHRTLDVRYFPLAVAVMHLSWGTGFLIGRSRLQR